MSVKVAIRVRPFNQRQKFLGCISCIQMKQNTTVLYQNKQKNKKQHYFTFDYSFWSHDQFTMRNDGYMMPTTSKYIDQQRIYNVIGREILQNAWNGYNCCLFAYGQTGAGKSYSMIGYGVNRGIIPMVCQQIFQKIKKFERKGEKQYEITLSMLQIYNQKVQDLFVPTSKRTQNGLKIRQNKTLGVYVEGLTKHQVLSYVDIQKRMDQGSKNKSLASTLMNEYSSRAHTIVMLQFVQKQWINKLKMNKKSSFINLVDLAGSERISKTGISDNKDRLKEASNINKSLHTLGRVIQVLAQQAAGKSKASQVPYRDSALTRILQTALGGNSKTTMICAISPANDNYEQTLSTLRYADQTKKIKNKPIVNESAVDKIIRQLREQNERLKRMLETPEEKDLFSSRQLGPSENEKKEMRSNLRASMREVQKEIRKNLKSFAINTNDIQQEEQSLMMTQFVDLEEPSQFFSQLSFDLGSKAQVYITNLNEDEQLNYKVRYSCQKDLLITNKNNKKAARGMEDFAKIVLCGLGIEENHAKIIHKGDKYYIEALSQTSSQYTLVNGKPVYERKELQNNDRIILGINSVFLFKNNNKKSQSKQTGIDYQFVINERQKQMQNLSIIPPSSLSLFLPTNFIRDNKTKDIYSGPPTQALNATKRLFGQENETEILQKISQIESEFDKLVKENEQKMKEKQQFYRNKLTELKKQKEKQKEQKSKIEEKLMNKTIESQSLKSKNSQLESLKKKLSKYVDQKKRRATLRESMLLESEDNKNNAIEEDIIGEFVDLEDPNEKYFQKKTNDFNGGANIDKKKKKSSKHKMTQDYEQVTVQQFENNEDIFKTIINARESTDSLLLADNQNYFTQTNSKTTKVKKITKKEVLKQRQAISDSFQMEQQRKQKALMFQFRRLYNIKILSQVQQDTYCNNCSANIVDQTKPEESYDSFAKKYVSPASYSDAQLEELHFKNSNLKGKKAKITEEDLLLLEQHIQQLQNKLVQKESKSKISIGSQNLQDSLLLNYSVQQSGLQKSDHFKKQQKKHKQSFSIIRFSKDQQINFSLSQQPQFTKVKASDLKMEVSQFIHVLSRMPQLNIVKQDQLTFIPPPKNKIELKLQANFSQTYSYYQQKKELALTTNEQLYFMLAPPEVKKQSLNLKENDDLLLLDENEQNVNQQQHLFTQKLEKNDFGVNTEALDEQQVNEKGKGTSFTAFLNEQLQQTNQNQTQQFNAFQKQKPIKQYAQSANNTSQGLQDEQKEQKKQTNQFGVQTEMQVKSTEMVTDINMHTYVDSSEQNEQENVVQGHLEQQKQNEVDSQIQNYLANKKDYEEKSINTEDIKEKQKMDFQTNTIPAANQSISLNTSSILLQLEKQVVDLLLVSQQQRKQSSSFDQDQRKIEQFITQKEDQDEIQLYLQAKKPQFEEIGMNTQRPLFTVNRQISVEIKDQQQSPIQTLKKAEIQQKVIAQFKLQRSQKLSLENLNIQVSFVPQKKQQLAEPLAINESDEKTKRNRPQMIDQQVQVGQKKAENGSLVDESGDDHKQNQNSQSANENIKHKEKMKQLGNSQQLADKFNLSVSDIQKHEFSYQQLSVFGFDGLLKEDQLNSKIKLLEEKIKQLESQSSLKPIEEKIQEQNIQKEKQLPQPQKIEQQNMENTQLKRQLEQITKNEEQPDPKASKYVPIKRNKKKKKKNQMTQQQKRQHHIEKQLQAKIIQCNNENIINQRSLQIHKRKRESEELRKILIKKQKVQLQKQLLVLIPMVRRFNLIAREMKRLIQGKISVEYRNFSHYEMVQILKSYSINKKAAGENIQIRIVILNCQEGRIYTWPVDVFKNRYQISEQTFQKFLQSDDDRDAGRNRMLEDRNEKSKDPFWDPVDYIPQGVGYLSLQSLLYSLSYQGYISIVYKSSIIAKLYVSLTPVKVKKQAQDQSLEGENEEESQLENIEIYNQRNLLEKQIYFTISIESIKFMKNEQRPKVDETNNIINLNSLNSNILKYSISYELLENDYKLINFSTPQIDFIEDKQFKRIDYLRRHSFKNISQATLAYISDCPVKFNLNVMKDYNEECLNASFTQDLNSQSDVNQLDTSHVSGVSDSNSIRPKKNSVLSQKDIPKDLTQPSKSDFSKKPNIIYENTQIVAKLETQAKKEQERRNNIKKMQENKAKLAKYEKQRQKDKDKDKEKDCAIY